MLGFDRKRYVGALIGIHNPAGQRVGEVGRRRNVEYVFVAGPGDRVDAAVAAAGDASLSRRARAARRPGPTGLGGRHRRHGQQLLAGVALDVDR